MNAVDLVAAWQQTAEKAADQYAPFPAGWMNLLPPDVSVELKGIAAMCDEANKIMADAALLLQDVLRDRLIRGSA